mmetsp:Transcript_39753/g.100159  ORF Transcript_39753/g.100159 Transcript_39753/m.100159 type:complete len:170 (+) Transcript_39753:1606-2115(+)
MLCPWCEQPAGSIRRYTRLRNLLVLRQSRIRLGNYSKILNSSFTKRADEANAQLDKLIDELPSEAEAAKHQGVIVGCMDETIRAHRLVHRTLNPDQKIFEATVAAARAHGERVARALILPADLVEIRLRHAMLCIKVVCQRVSWLHARVAIPADPAKDQSKKKAKRGRT